MTGTEGVLLLSIVLLVAAEALMKSHNAETYAQFNKRFFSFALYEVKYGESCRPYQVSYNFRQREQDMAFIVGLRKWVIGVQLGTVSKDAVLLRQLQGQCFDLVCKIGLSLKIVDESYHDSGLVVNIFAENEEKLPQIDASGDIIQVSYVVTVEYLSDKKKYSNWVDPSLKSSKNDDLEIICEVINECIAEDPRQRPTLREITTKLKGVIKISQDAATSRFSPLWWAELEILSMESGES